MANAVSIALSGLRAANRGIATTSHNIANANTEGYTRQRNIDQTARPTLTGVGFEGTGVDPKNISRIKDSYLTTQLQTQNSELGRLSTVQSLSEKLEKQLSASAIAETQTSFFNALEDAANNPQSAIQAENIIVAGKQLATQYNYLDGQLNTTIKTIDQHIKSEINAINQLTLQISGINQEITTAFTQGTNSVPNDLLDRREQYLSELSGHLSINVLERGKYSLDVTTGHGIPLVTIAGHHELTTQPRDDNPGMTSVSMETLPGGQDISQWIGSGVLGGLVEFQQEVLLPSQLHLGRAAAGISAAVNQQYQLAFDDPDISLFSHKPAAVQANSKNTGSATVTAEIVDAQLLSKSDYLIEFDGAEYTLTRSSDGVRITGPDNLSMDGIQFSIAPGAVAGDSFLVQPLKNVALSLTIDESQTTRLTRLRDIAAQSPIPVVELLASLRDTRLFDDGTSTVAEQFSILLSNTGINSRTATLQQESMNQIYNDTLKKQNEISGVSLDEEAASLLKYQRSYEASAKVISVASQMFDTLLATLRSL